MKAVITCAGYASRLWPLTKETPKPLLEVKGRPIIEHIIDKVSEIPDVDSIFVITNEKFYSNFEKWLEGKTLKVPVKILNDGTTSNYGFGWFLQPEHNTVAHGGEMPGFSTFIWRFIDDQLTVVLLSNLETAETGRIAFGVARLYVPALHSPEVKKQL